MRFRVLALTCSLLGLWLLPSFSWVSVLDTSLSGYEVFSLSGLLPWLVLLFVFISRYARKPGIFKYLGALVLIFTSGWIAISDFSRSSAVQERYESLTGLTISGPAYGISVSGTHLGYAGALALTALILVLSSNSKPGTNKTATVTDGDSRTLWEEQV